MSAFTLWRGIGVDYEGGILDGASRIAIQMAHRIVAVVLAVYLWVLSWRLLQVPGLRGWGSALALLVAVQVTLGILNVKLAVPLAVAVAHVGGAVALLFVGLTRDMGSALSAIGLSIGTALAFSGATFPVVDAPLFTRIWNALLPLTAYVKLQTQQQCVCARRSKAMAAGIKDYWDLTKPRVVALIVFTAFVGMFLAIPGLPSAAQLLTGVVAFVGIWLSAAAAAAINQLLDARIDAQMARTSWRPLVVGKVTPRQVLVFAGILTAVSMLLLVVWVNVITAVLTFASLIGYAVIYTVYLKRATSQNIVIGGLAGATPPLLGWAAITGMTGPDDWLHASLLVAIIFIWTPPHFWALAIFRRADYAKAEVPMLPVTHGVVHTRKQIFIYTVLLVIVSTLPAVVGMSGLFYLGGAIVLNSVFLWYAWKMLDPPDEQFNMKTFGYSILYLMALFAFLLIDHWLTPLFAAA